LTPSDELDGVDSCKRDAREDSEVAVWMTEEDCCDDEQHFLARQQHQNLAFLGVCLISGKYLSFDGTSIQPVILIPG
jgi:hypothetical protein